LNAPADVNTRLETRITSCAQVLLCRGCCCGRTDRGLPEVPVERIKAVWKAEKLNRSVQLTISGCLGPCDLPNVAVVMTPSGIDWFGLIAGDAAYDALIAWARACQAEGRTLPLPTDWAARRITRFREEPTPMKNGETGHS
jgi:cobaltochelatase CobN